MKKFKTFICLISAITLLVFIIIDYNEIREFFLGKEVVEMTDALKFKEEYESLNDVKMDYSGLDMEFKYPSINIDKDNPMKYSNADEIEELVKSGTGIVYLGYAKCPWCRNAVPALIDAAKDAGVGTIYYIDMENERDSYSVENGELVLDKDGTDGYKKLLEIFDEHLEQYYVEDENGKKIDTGEKRIYVPMVFFIRDGKVVGLHADTVSSHEDPFTLLNDEQYEELYDIYSYNIDKVLAQMCTERC